MAVRSSPSEYYSSQALFLSLSAEWLDAVGDRIGDVFLRNYADDLRRPSAALAPDHDAHAGVVPRHALHHVEHNVGFARQREIALRHVAKMDPAIGLLNAAA